MCEGPGDSLVFVKILNVLVLANQVHLLENEEAVKIVHDLDDTLLQLKWSVPHTCTKLAAELSSFFIFFVCVGSECQDTMKPYSAQLDRLIAEAQCQVEAKK